MTILRWADTKTISLTPTNPTLELDDLQAEIWYKISSTIFEYVYSDASKKVLDYMELETSMNFNQTFFMNGTDLIFFFSDEQGNADVSCVTVCHWFDLALGLKKQWFEDLLAESGYILESQYPDIKTILKAKTEQPLFELHHNKEFLCQAYANPDTKIRSDMYGPLWHQLDFEQQEYVEIILSEKTCCCEFCTTLRRKIYM